MFGRTVKVDGREFFVCCCPDTPLSEVLEAAARMAEREERTSEFADEYRRKLDQVFARIS